MSKDKLQFVYPKSADAISSNWKKMVKDLDLKVKPKVRNKRSEPEEERKFKNKKFKKEEDSVSKKEIWFEVDKALLEQTSLPEAPVKLDDSENALVKPRSFSGLTNVVGMDCEMVGVGHSGRDSILARVSIVNIMGHCIYDKYVKPTDVVTDYRTAVSGIRPSDLVKGEEFSVVQKEVSDIITGRILVGHSIQNDLKVLYLSHPRSMIRDTSLYKPFRRSFEGRTPSLKKLAERFLAVKVQDGEHSSIQDAQAAMRLYTMHRRKWEAEMKQKNRIMKKRFKSRKNNFAKTITNSHRTIQDAPKEPRTKNEVQKLHS